MLRSLISAAPSQPVGLSSCAHVFSPSALVCERFRWLPLLIARCMCRVGRVQAVSDSGRLYTWGGSGDIMLGHGDRTMESSVNVIPRKLSSRMKQLRETAERSGKSKLRKG